MLQVSPDDSFSVSPGLIVERNVTLPFSVASGAVLSFQVVIHDQYFQPGILTGFYYGESPVFTCSPSFGVYYPITGPNSSWQDGPFPLNTVGLGDRGALEVSMFTSPDSVPEPATAALLAVGCGVLLAVSRKR